jgi:hypothetical protein
VVDSESVVEEESEELGKDSKEGPEEEIGEVFVTESRTVTTLEEAVVVTCSTVLVDEGAATAPVVVPEGRSPNTDSYAKSPLALPQLS